MKKAAKLREYIGFIIYISNDYNDIIYNNILIPRTFVHDTQNHQTSSDLKKVTKASANGLAKKNKVGIHMNLLIPSLKNGKIHTSGTVSSWCSQPIMHMISCCLSANPPESCSGKVHTHTTPPSHGCLRCRDADAPLGAMARSWEASANLSKSLLCFADSLSFSARSEGHTNESSSWASSLRPRPSKNKWPLMWQQTACSTLILHHLLMHSKNDD